MKKLRILVPTDFSELSTNAFKHAAHLAELANGRITIFNSYKTGSPEKRKNDDPSSERNKKMYDLAAEHISPRYIEKCESSLSEAVEAIVTKSKDYDLVVMSSHGRTGFSRLMLGSVAEKVIRFSECPVLVVENGQKFFPLESILLTTDFSKNAYTAYPFARDLAKATGATIDLTYILSFDMTDPVTQLEAFKRTKEKQLTKEIDKYFSDIKDQVKTSVKLSRKSIHEELTNMIDKNKYNLAVMATLGRSGLEYLRLGSTTANVVRHVEIPVLVINPKSSKPWSS